jgi:1,4-dihydroxy-2-naphthoate octaprenyltransferase
MKEWIRAMRLRTLPLSLAGVLLGIMLAASEGYTNATISILVIITAVLLQILSNLANDYGDFIKGTDNENRVGPLRSVQSGKISASQMNMAIKATAALALATGLIMLWLAFSNDRLYLFGVYLLLGLTAIWAAIRYTTGESAYGYKGLGDLFVFVFFGLISVVGTYSLFSPFFNELIFYPASAIGFLSVGVLNLNNTRDIVNDKESGKMTIAVKLGFDAARNYQVYLFLAAMAFALVYSVSIEAGYFKYLYIIGLAPLLMVILRTKKATKPSELEPLLKIQALGTLLFALLMGMGTLLN